MVELMIAVATFVVFGLAALVGLALDGKFSKENDDKSCKREE